MPINLKKDSKLIELLDEINKKNICNHNFRCISQNNPRLGQVKDIGSKDFVMALDNPLDCNFSVIFQLGYLCSCPVRIYIAKKYEN